MNKTEFAKHIAKLNNFTVVEARRIIKLFTEPLVELVKQGERVSLQDFGIFDAKKVPSRRVINPITHKEMTIASCNRVRFKVGGKFKRVCNPQRAAKKENG